MGSDNDRAAASTARSAGACEEFVGFQRTASLLSEGTASLSSSTCLTLISEIIRVVPVTFAPGRKPTPTRCVLEAVLWILNTGAQWHMLPQSYPNYKTVHRRFQTWCRDEVLRRVLTDVANEL